MTAFDKTISCVITTYNSARFVQRAVESVLGQTEQVSEIVLADDCSTDGTLDILHALKRTDNRIRVLSQSVNVGPAANRHAAISVCKSKFVTYLDSDDWISPEKVAADLAVLEREPLSISVPIVAVADTGGRIIDSVDTRPFCEAGHRTQWMLLAGRCRGTPIGPIAMLKSSYMGVGGHNPSMRLYEDWDFHMRCLARGLCFRSNGLESYIYVRGHDSASRVARLKHLGVTLGTLARATLYGAPPLPLLAGAAHLLVWKPLRYALGANRSHGFN